MVIESNDHHRIAFTTWIGYLALCLGMFMAILDIQIVASSLPSIQNALKISSDNLSWIQTAYLIAEIIAIPLTGWLTRMLSLRGLFMAAVVGFTSASIGCALSHSFSELLVYRAIQGFFGGALIPIVFTSAFIFFPLWLHPLATTIGGFFAMVAPAIGPVLGGYITQHYDWQWLFLVNVIPGIIVAIVAFYCIKADKPNWRLLWQLDYLVVLLAAICLASLELILKEGPKHHWHGGLMVALALAFLASGMIAIHRSLTAKEPVIDVRRFSDFSFTIGCFYSFVLGMGLFGSVYLMPIYLGTVRQHNAFQIGKIMIVMGVAQLITAPFAALAEKKLSPILLTAFGYGLFTIGLVANGFMTYQTDFDDLFWPQVLRGIAVLFCLLPTTHLALEKQPLEKMSNASGLFNLMRNLGGAISIALIDTILEQRTPGHATQLTDKLLSGDMATAKAIGITTTQIQNLSLGNFTPDLQESASFSIQRAAFVLSFNEAWLILGGIFALAFFVVPFIKKLTGNENVSKSYSGGSGGI